jgi:hypothetical protein
MAGPQAARWVYCQLMPMPMHVHVAAQHQKLEGSVGPQPIL